MIRLGLIGLGDEWETVYLPALQRFAPRVEISTLFEPIAERAIAVAHELGCEATDGVRATAMRNDVDAVLVLDVGSLGLTGIRLAAEGGKPALVFLHSHADDADLHGLTLDASRSGQVLVPALAGRYAPATARLRELAATSVGRPREVVVRTASRTPGGLAELFDWCVYVGQSTPTSVSTEPLNGRAPIDLDGCRIRLDCRTQKGRAAWSASIENGPDGMAGLSAEVGCERGRVEITFPHTVSWSCESGETRTEVLDDERPEFDVMLDQFLRRVVGGLVPVPDLGDVRRGLRIGAAARESLASGRAVTIEGDDA